MYVCVQITGIVGKQADQLGKMIAEKARHLCIEGLMTVEQRENRYEFIIVACADRAVVDEFLDAMYALGDSFGIQEVQTKAYAKDRDYRGVFRTLVL